jgi:hypothetical protein
MLQRQFSHLNGHKIGGSEEVTGGTRKLRNEERHNLYFSPYIIRMNKSRTRWVIHLARTAECIQSFGTENDHYED